MRVDSGEMGALDKAATDLWRLTSTIHKPVAGAVFVYCREYPRARNRTARAGDAGSGGLKGDEESHAAHVQEWGPPLLPT